jgi:hypothetical protein
VALLLSALLMSAGVRASAAPDPTVTNELTLSDLLTADPRDSIGSCGSVDYGAVELGDRPPSLSPNPAGPTVVEILLFIIAIDQIDTETNSFRFEGYGGLVWCDPRLAFDAGAEGAEFRVFAEDNAWSQFDQIWWPGVVLPTQLGVPERTGRLLVVFADGTVRFSMKFNARMIAQYDFSEFPLDRQMLQIRVQTFGWRKSDLVIPDSSHRVGSDRRFKVP